MSRWVSWIRRWMPVLIVAGGSIDGGEAQQPAVRPSPPTLSPVRAVLERYCVGCHNSDKKKGRLDLEAIISEITSETRSETRSEDVSRHPKVWEKVVRKLRARTMPPDGEPRPDERTYDAGVSSLVDALDSAATEHPDPGRTDTFRRLNRT
ncbi:MAG: hypothetical protein O7J95_09185, partial [Planctomycetota bacterium]|nr:hypothetical protein [Planctomycetota bacterium]